MPGVANIFISGVIGESYWQDADEMGTTLMDVRRQYESFDSPDSVTVHIDSPGGDVWQGLAIHDYFINLGVPVTTIGEGRVFSIATVVLLAGDKGKRMMTPNATFMIHNPVSGEYGTANELEKLVQELRAIEVQLITLYSDKTGQDADKLREMMDAETFITASDALTLGFIDMIHQPVKAMAYFGKHKFQVMTNEKELEKARTFLSAIRSLFKNEVAANEVEAPAAAADPVPVTEAAPAVSADEVEALKAAKAEIEAKLAEMEAEKARLEKEKAEAQAATVAAEAKQKETSNLLAEVMKKVEALEALPILSGVVYPKPVAQTSEALKGKGAETLNDLANFFASRFNN